MALTWPRDPTDKHHTRSKCGGFTVSRHPAGLVEWYIAWAWPSTELGATRVPITASDGERLKAIGEMKALCETAATSKTPLTTKETPHESRGR